MIARSARKAIDKDFQHLLRRILVLRAHSVRERMHRLGPRSVMLVETLVEGTVELFANTCGELCAESLEGCGLCAQRFIGLVLQKGRRSQRYLPIECRGETIERLLSQTSPMVAQAGIGDRKQQAGQR